MIPDLLNRLIHKGGLTEQAIADSLGVHQSTVNRLRHGGSTSFETGRAIEELHNRTFRRKRARRAVS